MKKSIKFLWVGFIICIVLFNITIFAINKGWLGYMPKMEELENPKSDVASQIFSNEGKLIGKYYLQNREPVSFKDISPNVINALVSTEDERFYEHSGIDARAMGRAISGVITMNPSGGASTLTQQLAKNLFPREATSLFRMPFIKLKEMILAVKMEKNLTKDEIIALYLNTVPFGRNAYGIHSAAKTFFNKKPKDLELKEAAVLVGMLKANTLYDPIRNPEKSKTRRNVVFDQMVKNNKLSSSKAAELQNEPLGVNYQPQTEMQHEGVAPYFRQVVEQDVKRWCKTKGLNIYKDGLKIYTTLDTTMQKYAEEAVASNMAGKTRFANNYKWKKHPTLLKRIIKETDRYRNLKAEGKSESEIEKNFETKTKMKVFSWNSHREKDTTITPLDSIKYMRAFVKTGFMAMDPATGEVKAWVGDINHKYFQYDHVNEFTKRQVGSTIKPLLYCLAVDNGYSPCMTISCAPVFFPGHRLYNAGGSRSGAMPMKRALALSINNATLNVLKQVGIQAFVDFLVKMGIKSKLEAFPSIALGAFEISLIEMLHTYTMFPNYGINTKPIYITRIEDRNGNLLEAFVPERREIINEITAYKMIKMMQGTVDFGTARRLKGAYGLKGDICGKTGTTNDESDAWFMGYTPQLLGGVWVGCEDRFIGTGIGEGARAAMPIWGSFFKKVQANDNLGYNKITTFEKPLSMEGMDECDTYDQTSMDRLQNEVSRGIKQEEPDEDIKEENKLFDSHGMDHHDFE